MRATNIAPPSCTYVVLVWAPGDAGFAFPDFLGANLFGENGFQGFNVEIHYDNPRKLPFHCKSNFIRIKALTVFETHTQAF